MKINEITAQAVDKWGYIFHSLGIKVGNGKHCPCSICGGKGLTPSRRFRKTHLHVWHISNGSPLRKQIKPPSGGFLLCKLHKFRTIVLNYL